MLSRIEKNRLRKLIPAIILLPVIISLVLPSLLLRASIFDYVPGLDNDEIEFWHEILTFSKYGFSSGYYTIDETPAPASFTPYGVHGPIFPTIYGVIAHFVGWTTYPPIFFNAVLIIGALAGFVYLVKPDQKQLVYLGLTTAIFYPLLLFLPSIMQESLHYALVILMAGIFCHRQMQHRKWSIFIIGFFVIFIASALRYTWSLMLLPLLLLNFGKVTKEKLILLVFATIAFSLAMLTLNVYWSAPFPDYKLLDNLVRLQFKPIFLNAISNIKRIFVVAKPRTGEIELGYLALIFRLQLAMILLTILVSFFRNYFRKRRPRKSQVIILWALIHITVLQIFFYGVDGYLDYRILSPYVLLACLTLISVGNYSLINFFIVSSLVAAPFFVSSYTNIGFSGAEYARQFPASTRYEKQSIVSFKQSTEKFLVYSTQESPWCNTMNVTLDAYRANLVAVPPGIGISTIFGSENLRLPLKSKYILLGDRDLQPKIGSQLHPEILSQLHLKYLSSTPIGNLYFNLDSKCQALPPELHEKPI